MSIGVHVDVDVDVSVGAGVGVGVGVGVSVDGLVHSQISLSTLHVSFVTVRFSLIAYHFPLSL